MVVRRIEARSLKAVECSSWTAVLSLAESPLAGTSVALSGAFLSSGYATMTEGSSSLAVSSLALSEAVLSSGCAPITESVNLLVYREQDRSNPLANDWPG